MRLLEEYRTTKTVILVSHDITSMTAFCDRAIWLDKGKNRSDGEVKATCEGYLTSILGIPDVATSTVVPKDECLADQRQEVMLCSMLRNDIEVFSFNSSAAPAGTGHACIFDVRFENTEAQPYSWVVGGELVCVVVRARVFEDMVAPILGFVVKNRMGQPIIGDNTYLSYMDLPHAAAAGSTVEARFRFRMPRLPVGDYAITAAIADGTQQQKITHHLLHDVVIFRSHRSSVGQALVGLPMLDIILTIDPSHAN
jgi:lipopolysaccharide transport system ATP-binding protein